MGKKEGYGYPEGHHPKGLMGCVRQGSRSCGGQGNCWTNISVQGEGMVNFNSVCSEDVSTCTCVLMYVCISSSTMDFCCCPEYENKILFL